MTAEMKEYQKAYRVYNEDIIDLIISISENMEVDTYEKGVLVELLEIRNLILNLPISTCLFTVKLLTVCCFLYYFLTLKHFVYLYNCLP